MNRLECIQAKSRYTSEPHLVLMVDRVPFDEVLDRLHPDRNLLGLIPTLLDCLIDQREREVVWTRILPPIGCSRVAPVLMCPDDCDLCCTVVVAEVEATESAISWHRLGIDAAVEYTAPEDVGKTVHWLEQVGPFTFPRSDYEKCLSVLREGLTTA